MVRVLLLAVLFAFSGLAAAENYWWAIQGLPDETHADTPAASCALYKARLSDPGYDNISVSRVAENQYYCDIWKTGLPGLRMNIWRLGDGCADPAVFDPSSDSCKSPEPSKCEATKGLEVAHAHKFADVVDGKLTNYKDPPGALCKDSCAYASPATTNDGYRFVNGDPAGLWQNYSYLGNGQTCVADASNPAPNPPSDNKPSSSKSNECTNKVTDAEGRVHYSCLATDSKTEPGKFSCGTANGQLVCTTKKPSPSKVDSEKKTDVTETPGGDGSTTTTTTTTTTVTSCTGVNSCTTTTTVNNGTSKTNADGSSGGESSNCSGPGCKEGTGTSEEGADDEEEDEPKDEVSGDECGQPLSCSGDVIQCAVLKQQKQSRCDWNYQDAKPGIESEIAKPEYQVSEDSHDMSGLFSSAIGAARWLPAACPAPERSGLRTRGAGSIQLSWQPTCDFATSIGPVIVAMASLFFALYVGRGIGGGS